MKHILFSLGLTLALSLSQARADDLDHVNFSSRDASSLTFQDRVDSAERELSRLERTIHSLEVEQGMLARMRGLKDDPKAIEGIDRQIESNKKLLAAAKADLDTHFPPNAAALRDKMERARGAYNDASKHLRDPLGAVRAQGEYAKAATDFVKKWKPSPEALRAKGKFGGVFSLAVVAVPVAVEAVSGSRAEASELGPIEAKAPEAAETELAPVEISATLGDN